MAEPKNPSNVLGIDLGGHHLRVAVVDTNGTILDRKSVATEQSREPKTVIRQIGELANEFVRSTEISAIGVGVPGFVDWRQGRMISSPNFPLWNQFPLSEELNAILSRPCVLDNDANCAMLGESWIGAAKGHSHAICLTLGTGVGGGVMIEGKILRGTHGTAGEIGHMIIDPRGPACGCGGNGCLEAMVSGDSIQRKYGISVEEFFERAKQDDTQAKSVFEMIGFYLGLACTSMGEIFDTEMIVISGRISLAFEFFEPALKREVGRRLKKHPAKDLRVVQAKYPDDAGLLGAAYNAFFSVNPSDRPL